VILSWVNNHYNDFESNTKLSEFLEKFDDYLQHHETEVKTKKILLYFNLFIFLNLVYEIMEIFT
jgi:hypothetical protein